MASWLPQPDQSSPANLSERLERPRPVRRAGDQFGPDGWHRPSSAMVPPDPPSMFLVLLPYIVLFLVAVALTVGLLYAAGRV